MTVDVTFVIHRSAMARMSAIWASRPCRIPAPTTRRRSSVEKLSASISAMASQSPAAKCARKRSALGLPRFPAAVSAGQLFEPRERGVEVCLVEYFAAVDQVAFDRQDSTSATRRRSPLARSHRHLGDDRSEVAQPMHSLDVDADVWSRVPTGTDVCGHFTGRETLSRAGGRC